MRASVESVAVEKVATYTPYYALYCAIVAALGGFVFGFDASVISGVVGLVSTEFNLSPIQSGFVVAAPTLSGIIGSFFIGPLSDVIGRKKILILVSFLYLVSALASAFATSFYMLVAARAVGGIAFVSLMIAPMYIAEISPAKLRGKLVSINQLNIVLGLSVAYFSNYLILNLGSSPSEWVSNLGIAEHTWRWMLGMEIAPALIFFLALFSIPDSPRWLLLKGRTAKARIILSRLVPSEEVEQEIDLINKNTSKVLGSIWLRIRGIFGSKIRLALTIGLIVGVAQQITGINAIFFYAPTIFEQSGIGTNAAFAQAALVGVINVIFTIVAMALIDRWGRRPLLIVGLSGIALSLALCTYGFSQAHYELGHDDINKLHNVVNMDQHIDDELNLEAAPLATLSGKRFSSDIAFKQAIRDAIGGELAREHESKFISSAIHINPQLILIGILGFVASFAVSLGPVMWALFAEIFPNHLRGVAITFVGIVNSLVSFFVQLLFPIELSVLGVTATFFGYASFACMALGLVVWLLPETKGKSLEEIEELLSGRGKRDALVESK